MLWNISIKLHKHLFCKQTNYSLHNTMTCKYKNYYNNIYYNILLLILNDSTVNIKIFEVVTFLRLTQNGKL